MMIRSGKMQIAGILALVMLLAALPGCANQPAQMPAGSEAPEEVFTVSKPLSAADLNWAVEPIYAYDDVTVIKPDTANSNGFGWQLKDDRNLIPDERELAPGISDLCAEGCSWAPMYYAVQSGGEWYAFSMEAMQASTGLDRFSDYIAPGDGGLDRLEAEWGEIGVCLYHCADGNPVAADAPWNMLFRSMQTTSPGYYLELLWSETNGRSYLVNYDEGQSCFFGGIAYPISGDALSKPYPAVSTDSAERLFMKQLEEKLPDSGAYAFDFQADAAPEQGGLPVQSYEQKMHFGYVDRSGIPITDFVYSDAQQFSEGVAACSEDHTWDNPGTYLYLDEAGRPLSDERYDSCFPCTCGTIVAVQNGQTGLLYRDGSVMIEFGAFEDLAPACADLLWAKQDGKWGLLDLAEAKAQLRLPVDESLSAARQSILEHADSPADAEPKNEQPQNAEKDLQLYQQVLEDIRANPKAYVEQFEGERIDDEEFALIDLDQDGRLEMLVRYTHAATADSFTSIWAIRPNEAGAEQAVEIGRTYVNSEYYAGGAIMDPASHNHSYGETVWPYSVYRISEMTSAKSVENWERRIADAYSEDAVLWGKPGPAYDAAKDADGDGVIYYFNETDTPVPLTKAEYEAKVRAVIPPENLLQPQWRLLTAAEVASLVG